MSTEKLDLRTPQMTCPTCAATVAITKKGTIAQHTRYVSYGPRYSRWSRGWTHTGREKRCPSSFSAAPDGAHAAWLREVMRDARALAERARKEAADAQAKADASNADALTHENVAARCSEALAALGEVTP